MGSLAGWSGETIFERVGHRSGRERKTLFVALNIFTGVIKKFTSIRLDYLTSFTKYFSY